MAEARSADEAGRGLALVALLVSVAWLAYALLGGLTTIGRHFVPLALLRIALLGALVTFARVSGVGQRLGRTGLVVAAIGAALNLIGGVGSVVMDGWTFDPFGAAGETRTGSELWYAYVIGLSSFVFAIGTTLVGIASRSTSWLRISAILAGVLYLVAIPLGTPGHFIWIAPWIALAAGLATGADNRRSIKPV